MKIELAKSYGFCFGVKRAIKIAENSKNASTIGELIHNSLEIDRLKNKFNVKTLKDISELKNEKKAIIRTHGITKEGLANLKSRDVEIIDATCPFVTKPQQIVEKMSSEGYEIVFFGDINHPEVKGVMSYSSKNVYVILDESELETVKLSSKIAVVSQTTKKIEKFTEIVSYLIQRVKEVRVFNTICNATLENQEAVRELSSRADVMVIIGGKNSSNTKQLYLISKNLCPDSYLIESENELELKWFQDKKLCGISAGASTPEWVIQNVINKLENLTHKDS
ncbi:4-hydroxy-3-methylbut-2-enyl diphosphate reductase [Campylobacter fetus]|uniref:4-hydroxy-3-methylbut-2-enyl diphosphate reductase n=1 Tax=Campylobacter fetus subsp. testudinum TaxID=1507806 RepID=A0AAX0HDN8_CAMFE|nr:4-hydroxy-3-methylbut-2-enyl diphosphate reductase [Campylobacter fetus]AGZ82084.1 1-hydroxy-2-methyl-2-(E)-butenyl 4-diphosphate reductase [Campylobacter fetus subsp. testudinum 03-427]AJB45810.1 4-hydroxy-3-methylbut-2-enyl diphosphate reductase [Campylobacter fetus subsp. testudinum]ALV65252.1 1-hydroxy-2-methyl-2-(E)-butenyl 4-diphosphate reductase [Campylobacter fetus subsp. testudinum Sp3]AVK81508.1 4-hydroxy-3-methylbut-2-enyl diphosphate reductase [Campylobacter fetus subsp. testudin